MGIIEISQRPESARVLQHRLLVRWTVYRVWAHLGAHLGGDAQDSIIISRHSPYGLCFV